MDEAKKEDEAMNEFQAAEYLGLSTQTVRNWRCQRKGPKYCKFGNKSIRYYRQDLEEYKKKHKINPKE